MSEHSPHKPHEIQLDEEDITGGKSFEEAMKELEEMSLTPAAEPPTKPAVPAEKTAGTKELIEQAVNECTEAKSLIADFRKKHPYLIAPNMLSLMEDHLQENIHTMSRLLDQKFGGQS